MYISFPYRGVARLYDVCQRGKYETCPHVRVSFIHRAPADWSKCGLDCSAVVFTEDPLSELTPPEGLSLHYSVHNMQFYIQSAK